jgi:hypothetical protein
LLILASQHIAESLPCETHRKTTASKDGTINSGIEP